MVDAARHYAKLEFKCENCGKIARIIFEEGNTGGWAAIKTAVCCPWCNHESRLSIPGKYLSVEKVL
jgi:hypothetical protein